MTITLDGSNLTTTGVINSGTAVATTSGTIVTFTGIPAGAKRVTVMFQGVSTNGTSYVQVQIGSGSLTTTGYVGSSSQGTSSSTLTTGFGVGIFGASGNTRCGIMTLTLLTGNTWIAAGNFGLGNTGNVAVTGGYISLSGTLDRLAVTTVNGTDAFNAGSVNVFWE